MDFRVGIGYDVHQLKEGASLMIGGIEIDHTKGSIGHSDADVLIHSICDALLGAANLRDIGYHFPNTDPDLDGIDSKIILKKTIALLEREGWIIGNVDNTICLQKPKLSGYIDRMQEVLAEVMSVNKDQVTIKCTTTEKLGFVGREEGISAMSVVIIKKV